jgi:ankyrin repeat protein
MGSLEDQLLPVTFCKAKGNCFRFTSKSEVTYFDNLVIYKVILDHGVDMNKNRLHYASEKGKKDVCKLLLDCGADVNAKDNSGRTSLHRAAASGHKDVCELLIKHGANVNAKTIGSTSPLHFAAAKGHADVCELLLDHGADVNAVDNTKDSPLQWSIDYGHKDVCVLLIKYIIKCHLVFLL